MRDSKSPQTKNNGTDITTDNTKKNDINDYNSKEQQQANNRQHYQPDTEQRQ